MLGLFVNFAALTIVDVMTLNFRLALLKMFCRNKPGHPSVLVGDEQTVSDSFSAVPSVRAGFRADQRGRNPARRLARVEARPRCARENLFTQIRERAVSRHHLFARPWWFARGL